MIEYSKTSADTKNRVKDLAWMNGRYFIYISCVLGAAAVVLLVLGIAMMKPSLLGIAIQLLAIALADLVVFRSLYKRFEKAVTKNFDEFAVDDRIDYTIETTEEGKLLFTRLTDEDAFEISWADIKKIRYMKTIVVLVLKDKRTIDIPRSVDIAQLLGTPE